MLKTRLDGRTVIKAGTAGPILKRLSTVDLADHLGEARQIVDAAKEQAVRTMSAAEEERERLAVEAEKAARQRGYEKGYADGQRAGQDAAFEESMTVFEDRHADVVRHMDDAVRQIAEMKQSLRIAAERDVLDFAVRLATELTFAIGRTSHESVIENLKRALRLVGQQTDLTIRVHPDDAHTIETYAASLRRRIEETDVVSVVSDGSLSPGGCIVETGRSAVDATLDTQIHELTSMLLGAVPANESSTPDE